MTIWNKLFPKKPYGVQTTPTLQSAAHPTNVITQAGGTYTLQPGETKPPFPPPPAPPVWTQPPAPPPWPPITSGVFSLPAQSKEEITALYLEIAQLHLKMDVLLEKLEVRDGSAE